jgi:hypothetical protein
MDFAFPNVLSIMIKVGGLNEINKSIGKIYSILAIRILIDTGV